jgi:hypothetical protein
VFVVGSGIDLPLIKPTLEAATALPVSAPEEPETALARGAALASANAPLFVSSTAARAYAQDPGTGAVLPYAPAAHGYYDVPAGADAADALAYSAVPDDFADAYTASRTGATGVVDPERRSFTLVGSALAAIFVVGVAALVVSLAITIRPTAGVRPDPGHNVVAPAPRPVVAPAPAPAAAVPAPAPAPAPAPPAPAAVPQEAPAPAPVPVPQAPAPIPEVPAPAPVPVPAAPAPAPPPIAPPPVLPVPLPLPFFGGPPGGGGHYGGGEGPGGGHFGGGFPGFPGGGGHGGFGGGHGGGHR